MFCIITSRRTKPTSIGKGGVYFLTKRIAIAHFRSSNQLRGLIEWASRYPKSRSAD